jgi:hypothetical protein
MDLEQTLLLHSLKLKAHVTHGGSPELLEALIKDNPEPMRQICARISPALYESVSNLSGLLGIPQRAFIEMALVHAVNRAESTLEEQGVTELLTTKG